MTFIHIFTDSIAIPVFLVALLISFLVYRNYQDKKQKLLQVSSFSFSICILIGVSYFMYGLSSDMSIENVGPYAAVLLLPMFYSALFSIGVRLYTVKKVT